MKKQKEFKEIIKAMVQVVEYHFRACKAPVKLLLIAVSCWHQLLFRLELFPGTKVDKVLKCADDIKTALHIPTFIPFQDGNGVFLLISDCPIPKVSLARLLASTAFHSEKMSLPIALGCNMIGKPIIFDLAKSPHILYGGATNSGKSTGLKCLVVSLLMQAVRHVNLILFGIGTDSLDQFAVPHLSHPIIKDVQTGAAVLNALVAEMDRRAALGQDERTQLPQLVCVIDEFPSLLTSAAENGLSKVYETALSTLLQRGRGSGIHVVLAAQNPTSEYMKVDAANIPTRIAFKCAKYTNSIAILGEAGAEKLSGAGSLLYKSAQTPDPMRVQGAYITDDEITAVVAQINATYQDLGDRFVISPVRDKTEQSEPMVSRTAEASDADGDEPADKGYDYDQEELARIILSVLRRKTVSAKQIMEEFHMSNRAYDIMEQLTSMDLVSEQFSNQPRTVLANSFEEVPIAVVDYLMDRDVTIEEITEAVAQKAGS